MFNPTFRRREGSIPPVRSRSPSPPRRFHEPLSPPTKPAPIEPHFNYPAIDGNLQFRAGTESVFAATPNAGPYDARQKREHHRRPSTIDTLAEVALSAGPSYQAQPAFAVLQPNGVGHARPRDGEHDSEPPHKRARSDALPFHTASQYVARPATSYVPMYGKPNLSATPIYTRDNYERRVEEAALLLNFRTGGWPTLDQCSHLQQSSILLPPAPARPHANSFPQSGFQPRHAEIIPHVHLLPPFDPQEGSGVKSLPPQQRVQDAQPSPEVHEQISASSATSMSQTNQEATFDDPTQHLPREDAPIQGAVHKAVPPADGETSRATSVGVPLSEGSENIQAKKRRGWPKGKPRGAGARKTVAEKVATKRAAARRKTLDPKKAMKRRRAAEALGTSDGFEPTSKRRGSTGDLFADVDHPVAARLRMQSVPADIPMIVRVTSPNKISRRTHKTTPNITCAGCAITRDVANSNGELKDEWVSCNGCKSWFHVDCAGFKKAYEVRDVDKFFCTSCEAEHGKTTWVRKSTRAHVSVDYAELQKGVLKTSEESMEHHYIQPIKDGDFQFDPEYFPRMPPELITREFLERGGFTEPICIPAALNPRPWAGNEHAVNDASSTVEDHASFGTQEQSPEDFEYDVITDNGQDKLDMVMPQDLTVRQVSELVGPETTLEVIDVKTQGSGGKKWNLARWADYYEEDGDKQIRNVISLEVSQTKLGRLLQRPKVVRDIDLQDQVWPAKETEQGRWPKVQFYCLMSVADSYTDFHIDFGGSSVYYHILKGKKTFFFIPPKSKHLKAYEEWNDNPQQNFTFLPNITNECYRVDLGPGDTMLIPSGWIHAVWTPETSLVIGGNFLTRLSYQNQFKVAQIEKNNGTPRKFRYPFFQRLMWYTAIDYLEKDPLPEDVSQLFLEGKKFTRNGTPIWMDFDGDLAAQDSRAGARNQRYYSQAELEGLPDLVNYIFRTVMLVMGRLEGISADLQKRVNSGIPKGYGEPLEIAKTFALWVAWKRGDEDPPAWAHPDAVLPNKEEGAQVKKLSARALRDMERKEAIAAWRVVPDRQSARVKAAAEAAASGPPLSNTTPEPETSAHSRELGRNDHRHHQPNSFAASPSHQQSASMLQPMQFAMEGMPGQYLSTPKTSVLGPKRVACDACRKRRIRCKHKDLVVQAGDPYAVSQPWQSTSAIDATPSSSVHAPEMLSDDIQVSPVRYGNYMNGFHPHDPDSPNGTSPDGHLPGPLPGTNAYISQNIPMAINGVPMFGDSSKRGRSKACAECRKSKRRCIHDENGHVDPIKAAESPVPRGSVAIRKRLSTGETDSVQVTKKLKASDEVADQVDVRQHDASDDQTAQALAAALGREPYSVPNVAPNEPAKAPQDAPPVDPSIQQQSQQPPPQQPLIDPSLSMYNEPQHLNPFANNGYPYSSENSQPYAFNTLEAIASEVLDMNGGHPDEGYAAQEAESTRSDNQTFDDFVSAEVADSKPAKPDGSIDSAVSIHTSDSTRSASASSPRVAVREELQQGTTQTSVEVPANVPVASSPGLSRHRPSSSKSNVDSLPLYRPPPPPSASPEFSKRRPLIGNSVAPKANGIVSSTNKRKRDSFGEHVTSKKPVTDRRASHSSNGPLPILQDDKESLELAKALQQDDLGLRKRGK